MEMQQPRTVVAHEEITHLKPQKKKPPNKVTSAIQKKGWIHKGKETPQPPSRTKKVSKKIQDSEASTPDPALDSSISGDQYRALRHKYLMLEEETLSLDTELTKAEGEVKTLEGQKFALLDQLVVFEGLMDPSEIKIQVQQ